MCPDVPLGDYFAFPGTERCYTCPAGLSKTAWSGEFPCEPCPAGSASSANEGQCLQCGPGRYAPEPPFKRTLDSLSQLMQVEEYSQTAVYTGSDATWFDIAAEYPRLLLLNGLDNHDASTMLVGNSRFGILTPNACIEA